MDAMMHTKTQQGLSAETKPAPRRVRDPSKRAAMQAQMMESFGLGVHSVKPPSFKTQRTADRKPFLPVPTPVAETEDSSEMDEEVLAAWNTALAASLLPVDDTSNYIHLQPEVKKPPVPVRDHMDSASESMGWSGGSDDERSAVSIPGMKRSRSPNTESREEDSQQQMMDMLQILMAQPNTLEEVSSLPKEEPLDLKEMPLDFEALTHGQRQTFSNVVASGKTTDQAYAEMQQMVDQCAQQAQAARAEVDMHKMMLCQLLMQQQQAQTIAQLQTPAAMQQQILAMRGMSMENMSSTIPEPIPEVPKENTPKQMEIDAMMAEQAKNFSFCEYVPGQKAKRGRPRGPRNIFNKRAAFGETMR